MSKMASTLRVAISCWPQARIASPTPTPTPTPTLVAPVKIARMSDASVDHCHAPPRRRWRRRRRGEGGTVPPGDRDSGRGGWRGRQRRPGTTTSLFLDRCLGHVRRRRTRPAGGSVRCSGSMLGTCPSPARTSCRGTCRASRPSCRCGHGGGSRGGGLMNVTACGGRRGVAGRMDPCPPASPHPHPLFPFPPPHPPSLRAGYYPGAPIFVLNFVSIEWLWGGGGGGLGGGVVLTIGVLLLVVFVVIFKLF